MFSSPSHALLDTASSSMRAGPVGPVPSSSGRVATYTTSRAAPRASAASTANSIRPDGRSSTSTPTTTRFSLGSSLSPGLTTSTGHSACVATWRLTEPRGNRETRRCPGGRQRSPRSGWSGRRVRVPAVPTPRPVRPPPAGTAEPPTRRTRRSTVPPPLRSRPGRAIRPPPGSRPLDCMQKAQDGPTPVRLLGGVPDERPLLRGVDHPHHHCSGHTPTVHGPLLSRCYSGHLHHTAGARPRQLGRVGGGGRPRLSTRCGAATTRRERADSGSPCGGRGSGSGIDAGVDVADSPEGGVAVVAVEAAEVLVPVQQFGVVTGCLGHVVARAVNVHTVLGHL